MKRIPDTLQVVLRPARKLSRTVMDAKETLTVRPAFLVTTDSEAMMETAVAWGHDYYTKKDYRQARDENRLRGTRPEVFTKPNDEFIELVLWDVWHRSQGGGTVYRVITTEGWFVDLREEEFMECLLAYGMTDCKITGRFRWLRNGTSQMRIAIVGSKLYRQCVEDDKREVHKPISMGNLKVGGVYRGSHPHEQIYLGRVQVGDKVLHAFLALNSYSHSRNGCALSDYQGRYIYEAKRSPRPKATGTKKLFECLGQVDLAGLCGWYLENGWGHQLGSAYDPKGVQWLDITVPKGTT